VKVARLLLGKLVAVEAGTWNVGAAERLRRSGLSEHCLRLLLEPAWLQKGQKHRALAFRIAHDALKKAAQRTPAPRDWHELEKADKMARRAAGLENDDATKVNVSLNLVNQRILAMQLAAE
jgi:hypothetical protein